MIAKVSANETARTLRNFEEASMPLFSEADFNYIVSQHFEAGSVPPHAS